MTQQKDQFLAARISIAGSIVLFLISAVIGIAVDSITLILDSSTSLVILVTGFLMHFSIKKVHTPPDERYNFGYHKYEPLTAVIQNILIVAMCIVSIKFAIQDIFNAEDVRSYGLPAIAVFVSGILGVFITVFFKIIARRTNSEMIKSAAFHWLNDTVLSFGIAAGFLFGLIMKNMGKTSITPYIDPAMSIVLALFFIFTPFKSGMRNLFELLDAVPHEDIQGRLRKAIDLCRPDSFIVHQLKIRKAGQRVFMEICFLVEGNLTIKQIEDLSGKFKKGLKTHFLECDAVVYFKPK